MSASSTPILSPCARSARARLQAVVDLPTPPLPDATAMTCLTPGMIWARGEGACAGRPGAGAGEVAGPFAAGRSAVRLANTPETPGSFRIAASAASRAGSAAAASLGSIAIENMTRPVGSIRISDRRPDAARLGPPSPSFTVASACRTCSRVIATLSLRDACLGAGDPTARPVMYRGEPSRVRAAATKPGVVRCSVPRGSENAMAANQNDPNAQKLFDLVRDVRVCMMTTEESDGSLHSRPMYSMEADERGNLWFFTKLQSPKVAEISKDRQVNLAYADPDKQHYVSISGVAEVVRDKAVIADKWSEGVRAWFPDGKDDPALTLIRVKPVRGEYWDSPSSTFVQLYGYVKSTLTGQPATDVGEQKKVSLR